LANSFPSLDYGIVELPSGPSGRGTTAFVSCWVVSAGSDNVAGALALASFLASPAQQSAWANVSGNLPPTIELATAWVANHPNYAPFVAAMPYATAWSGSAGFIAHAETVNLSMDMWYNDNMTTPELVGVLSTMSENAPLPTPTATASPPE
jgi:ABC-type glycerol-3-phosphate transport system substrate-binding protein